MSLPTGVLFVCLGNICRSPLARLVFTDLVERQALLHQFDIDSCGTGAWHVGEGADPRSCSIARRHGLELRHVARQLDPGSDFDRFEWLIAMDRNNARHMLAAGAPERKVHLLRSFDPALEARPDHELEVPDPYHWPGDGFEEVFQMIQGASRGLLARLLAPKA